MKHFLRCLVLAAVLWPVAATAQVVGLSIPETTAPIGSDLWLPVRADTSVTGLNVTSLQLQFTFDQNMLDPDSLILTGVLLEGLGWTIDFHRPSAGVIRIAAAGTTPLTGSGPILFLRVKVLTTGWTEFRFSGVDANFLNEGQPSVTLDHGWVQITQPPSVDVWPDEGIVAVGEHLSFSTGGGSEPYAWSTSDPEIASIDGNGLLTAISRGSVQVFVQDATGKRGRTDRWVVVRAVGISVPETSIPAGSNVDVPVSVTTLSPWNITAGSVRVNYHPDAITAIEVLTAGTILDGIAPTVNLSSAGSVRVSFAATQPLSGQGTLFIIRFQAAETPNGSNLEIVEALFNEELPAKVDNGYLSVSNLSTISLGAPVDHILAEDSLEFSVWGGEAPYTWSSSDTTVAMVTAEGRLVGVRSGRVRVTVRDALGAIGISNEITVYDGAILIVDRLAASPGWVDVPVRLHRLASGRQFSSYQVRLAFNADHLVFESLTTVGTATSGWSSTYHVSGSTITIAGATTGFMNDAGTLCTIRFAVLPSIPVNSESVLSIESVLLNEGFPDVDRMNGRVRIAELPARIDLWTPGNGWTQQPPNVSLGWGAVSFAEQYELQVAVDTAFTSPVIWDSTITETTFIPGGLGTGVRYYWRVRARNIIGVGSWSQVWEFTTAGTDGVVTPTGDVPERFGLDANYPNPFNPSTRLTFRLKETSPVTLTVYTLTGIEVERLVASTLPAGTFETHWDAARMPSGIYLCRMTAGRFTAVQRMVLIK